MGRETKILLGLLAVLAGVFLGVLAVKLLVPRPPAGAGPDIRTEVAVARPIELVEPPALDPPAPPRKRFLSAPAAPAAMFEPSPGDAAVVAVSPETPAAAPTPMSQPSAAPARDPFIERASFTPPIAVAPPAPAAAPAPTAANPSPGGYFCRPGDSWWSLAEQAYGDGRLYRALFAWNRTLDPRVSLTPGTRLELPPRERLEAAWPRLLPSAATR